jgi:adenine-specific DNA-methyltransferase
VTKNELYNTNSAFNEETRPNLVFNIHYNFATKEVRFTDVDDTAIYDGFVKIPPKSNNNGTHQYHAWRWGRDKIQRETDDLKFVESKVGAKVFTKIRGFAKTIVKDIITDVTTKSGSDECKEVFGASKVFDYPKPSSLLELLIGQMNEDSIVLDSFAGSGTTAHAVLNLNKQAGGNRKFILIEMMDYAEGITAERVKRVMQGYGEGKKAVEGTGGAFDYYTLGQPLFNADQNLNEAVGTERIREYIWYSETRSPLPASAPAANGKAARGKGLANNPYLLGTHEGMALYFVYEPERLTTLDHELLATLPVKGAPTLIYADNCLLPKKFLEQHGIVFKKIPRDISRF